MMVKVDPKKYVKTSAKIEHILYVNLNKVLYGFLKNDLLWCKILRSKFEEKGFEVNLYDPCVAH